MAEVLACLNVWLLCHAFVHSMFASRSVSPVMLMSAASTCGLRDLSSPKTHNRPASSNFAPNLRLFTPRTPLTPSRRATSG